MHGAARRAWAEYDRRPTQGERARAARAPVREPGGLPAGGRGIARRLVRGMGRGRRHRPGAGAECAHRLRDRDQGGTLHRGAARPRHPHRPRAPGGTRALGARRGPGARRSRAAGGRRRNSRRPAHCRGLEPRGRRIDAHRRVGAGGEVPRTGGRRRASGRARLHAVQGHLPHPRQRARPRGRDRPRHRARPHHRLGGGGDAGILAAGEAPRAPVRSDGVDRRRPHRRHCRHRPRARQGPAADGGIRHRAGGRGDPGGSAHRRDAGAGARHLAHGEAERLG